MEPLTVLVIDDDEDDYLVVRDSLAEIQDFRCRSRWIKTYEDGLHAVREGGADVCLLDFRLGPRSGLELLKEAAASGVRVPIIMLTGQANRETDREAMSAGASDYLSKIGLDVEILERAIRYAVERRRVEEAQIFLVEASRLLVGSLDARQILPRLARLTVPRFASACTIDVIARDGRLERAASAYDDPEKDRLLAELRTRFPMSRAAGGHPVFQVIDSGTPIFHPDITPQALDDLTTQPEERAMVERILPTSCVVAPLTAGGRTLGAISLGTSGTRRRFDERDLQVAEDLANRIALALDNARLYEDMQHALLARDEVLAVVSHDLRSPLNTISLSLSMLGEGEPSASSRPIQVIRRACHNMKRLIDDLLDVVRIEAGQLAIEREAQDVGAIAREVAEMHQAAAERRVTLAFDFDGVPKVAYVDRQRIQQVLDNLVGNALKFTPGGGRIALRVSGSEDAVRVSVSDTGPGITAADQAKLFERFWQKKRTGRQGAGLGLAISNAIVQAHGSRLVVQSEVGKGTTFSFDLSITPPAPP